METNEIIEEQEKQIQALRADIERKKTWNKWFYEMVRQMRELQKGYNRNQDVDPARIRAEVELAVDREIQRIEAAKLKQKPEVQELMKTFDAVQV